MFPGSSKPNQFESPGADELSDKLPSEAGEEEKELADVMENNSANQPNKYTPRESSRREVSFDVREKQAVDKPPETRATPKSTPG